MVTVRSRCSGAARPAGGGASQGFPGGRSARNQRRRRSGSEGADPRTRYERPWEPLSSHPFPDLLVLSPSNDCLTSGSAWAIMVAKNRKQTGKSPATRTDRDRSPLVSPSGKSSVRRPGREGKAFGSSHSNGLSGIRQRLGLSPSAVARLGVTVLLGKLGALAC